MPTRNGLRQPIYRVRLDWSSDARLFTFDMFGLRNRVVLWVVDTEGDAVRLPFVIDSGASYSIISLRAAEYRGIAVPSAFVEEDVELETTGGRKTMRVRPGRIRTWWSDSQEGYPFDWPVLFRVDAPVTSLSILGLGGVLKTCRWTFDGAYTPDAPFGQVTLEDVR